MIGPNAPKLSEELAKRIRIVRRDIGSLLFHFTRKPPGNFLEITHGSGAITEMSATAYSVLRKIIAEGFIKGTDTWTKGESCICFTEAPIQEFNSLFSLAEIASTESQRPRYEPYGVAVSKKWFFAQGGRPVIYDHFEVFDELPKSQQYRFVPYDPTNGIDYTWEREWRIRSTALSLDPKETLVVVPTADEAFEMAYGMADMEADYDDDGSIQGAYHVAKWLTVSLDLFGYEP